MRGLVARAAIAIVVIVVGWTHGAVGATEHASEVQAQSGISSLPSWLHKTMHATAYVAPVVPAVPNVQPVGAAVPSNEVTAIVSDGGGVRFGLAFLHIGPGETYPALSADSGVTWHVDGPLFHVNAAQASLVVGSTGTIELHGAYFWGQGGNIIWMTYDEGAHWWTLEFANSVDRVSAKKGVLDAVVLGDQVKGGEFQGFLFVSTDSGRTWRFHRELANVRV